MRHGRGAPASASRVRWQRPGNSQMLRYVEPEVAKIAAAVESGRRAVEGRYGRQDCDEHCECKQGFACSHVQAPLPAEPEQAKIAAAVGSEGRRAVEGPYGRQGCDEHCECKQGFACSHVQAPFVTLRYAAHYAGASQLVFTRAFKRL